MIPGIAQDSLRTQLSQSLPLLTDAEIRDLEDAIETPLKERSVRKEDAANYSAWFGSDDPQPVPSERGWFGRLADWLGLGDPQPSTEISDEAWEVRKADCVAYAERVYARQPDEQPVDDQWVPDERIQERFWAGDPLPEDMLWQTAARTNGSELGSAPQSWEPRGDGMEPVRINPAVADAIERWFAERSPRPAAGDAASRQAKALSKRLVAIEYVVRDSYRRVVAPSRSITPGRNMRTFLHVWILFGGICLGITALTSMETWRMVRRIVGEPNLFLTITWVLTTMSKAAGFLLICAVGSAGLGILWSRYVARIRVPFVRGVLGWLSGYALLLLMPYAVNPCLITNPVDYVGIATWWAGSATLILVSLIMDVLVTFSFFKGTGLVDDWHRVTRTVLSLTEVLASARLDLDEVQARLEHPAGEGLPPSVAQSLRVHVDQVADLLECVRGAAMPY